KVNTSWTSPNELYESTVKDFIHDCLHSAEFLMAISTPAVVCHGSGVQNSFCQTLLKLTAPGIPDTYQGTELTDYSLVDPDNRRPVDFSLRQEKLNNILSDQDPGGEFEDNLKLEIHMRVLELRRKYPDLFTTGKYVRVE